MNNGTREIHVRLHKYIAMLFKSYKIHFMGPETKFNIHMRPIQKKMVHHTDMWSESKMHKNLEKSSNVPKILAKMKNNFVKRIYVCMRK